jgi:Amt family ammonium transporter
MYLIVSWVITALIYPIPAHVAWDPRGFGYQLGFVDFAGSGVVHAAGGLMGLIATLKLGPRQGVFSSSGAYFPVSRSGCACGVCSVCGDVSRQRCMCTVMMAV